MIIGLTSLLIIGHFIIGLIVWLTLQFDNINDLRFIFNELFQQQSPTQSTSKHKSVQ